jgi:hypothetical protein
MDKIVLTEKKLYKFNEKINCFSVKDGILDEFQAYPKERYEPELVLHVGKSDPLNIIAEGQYKWLHNCSHLLYDVLSDFFIIKSVLGAKSVKHKGTKLSNSILDFLSATVVPGDRYLDRGDTSTSEMSYIENPWRFAGHKHSYITKAIKSTLNPLLKSDSKYPKKIILQRRLKSGMVRNRNIDEVDKLLDYLSAHGEHFTIVFLEDLSLTDQINTFYNAEKIISIHGSGLVWLNFCKEKTKCLEILPPLFRVNNSMKPDFWYMGQQGNIDYRSLYVDEIVGENPKEAYAIDIKVEPKFILELIK